MLMDAPATRRGSATWWRAAPKASAARIRRGDAGAGCAPAARMEAGASDAGRRRSRSAGAASNGPTCRAHSIAPLALYAQVDASGAGRSAASARTSTGSTTRSRSYVRSDVGAVSRSAESLCRGEGVRVMDGLPGARRRDDRAWARGGAGASCASKPPDSAAMRNGTLDADLLREAFRSADFILNHLAVGEELAEAWSVAES